MARQVGYLKPKKPRPRAPMYFYAIQSINNPRVFLPFLKRTTRIGKLWGGHTSKFTPRLWRTKQGATIALRHWEKGFWKTDKETKERYLKIPRLPGEVGSMHVVKLEVRQVWPL